MHRNTKSTRSSIVYYLEPFLEKGNPTFRLGTFRNHLRNEIKALTTSSSNSYDFHLVCRSEVYTKIIEEKLIDFPITVSHICPQESFKASDLYRKVYFEEDYSDYTEEVKSLLEVDGFKSQPDLVFVYEGSIAVPSSIWPNARILNVMQGFSSRAPYFETSFFDDQGLYSDSTLLKNWDGEYKNLEPTNEEFAKYSNLKNIWNKTLNRVNPLPKGVLDTEGYDKVALLPLQVSDYFTFDYGVNYELENQEQFLHHVMSRVDPKVAVVVTMHGLENQVVNSHNYNSWKEQYPNLFFFEELNDFKNLSQWLVPHVDFVISISSSVAFQALMAGKMVVGIMNGYFKVFNFELERLSQYTYDNWKELKPDVFMSHLINKFTLNLKFEHHGEGFLKFIDSYISGKPLIDCVKQCKHSDDFENYLFRDEEIFNSFDEKMFTASNIEAFVKDRNKKLLLAFNHDAIDVISFDLFDTLITRRLINPNKIFDMLDRRVNEIMEKAGESINVSFSVLRKRACDRAMKHAKQKGFEEFNLIDAYDQLPRITGLSEELIKQIYKAELELEKKLSIPLKSGKKLFEAAQQTGKKVIITSDIYLPKRFILFLIKRAGYQIHDSDVLVSSDVGLLKSSGKLYRHLREEFPGNVIHIGDNYVSDYLKADKNGILGKWVPCYSYMYEKKVQRDVNDSEFKISNNLVPSFAGLVSRRFELNNGFGEGFFNNDPYRLGYTAIAPFIFSFSRWIAENVSSGKYDKVLFLARDGWIPYLVYNKLASLNGNLPEASYIHASRRLYNFPIVTDENSLFEYVDSLKSSENKIGEYLKYRFNIDSNSLDSKKLKKYGFQSFEDSINLKRRSVRNKLKGFLTEIKELIYANAKKEKDTLLEYLKSEGVSDDTRLCIVDIGHNGSLQKALSNLLKRKVDGLYFATFSAIEKIKLLGVGEAKGYYLSGYEPNDTYNPYHSNIGMYELIFLSPTETSIGIKWDEKTQKYTIVSPSTNQYNESIRCEFISKVYDAVLDFTDHMIETYEDTVFDLELSKEGSVWIWNEFIIKPNSKDVSMIEPIYFVDAFGGNMRRKLVADKKNLEYLSLDQKIDFYKDSWWRGGALAYFDNLENEFKVNGYTDKHIEIRNTVVDKTTSKVIRLENHIFHSDINYVIGSKSRGKAFILLLYVAFVVTFDKKSTADKILKNPALLLSTSNLKHRKALYKYLFK